MSAIANTFVRANDIGVREDLSDLISNISPTETPFQSNAGTRPRAKQTFYEWQIDSLAAVDTGNAQNDGNDYTSFTAVTPTSRVGNYTQISALDFLISGTVQAVDAAGRKSEIAYQLAKNAKVFKRNIEATCLERNTGASNSDPRNTAVLLSYVRTNTVKGVGGADPAAPSPAYSGNRTDGTQVAFTETILKTGIVSAYTTGMKIDGSTLMLGPTQKGVFSAFNGIATKFKDIPKGMATIVGAADVYVSDFGEIAVVPNRFQRNRDAWLLDWDLIGLKDLRPYSVIELAKTGDADKRLLLREWSLQVDNEAGLLGIFDLS